MVLLSSEDGTYHKEDGTSITERWYFIKNTQEDLKHIN